jgi:hypothetical protein
MVHRTTMEEQVPSGWTFLRRRDFLALGSVGLVAFAFGDFAWAQPLVAPGPAARPMPVGYIETSETVRDLKRLTPRIRRPGLKVREEDEVPLSIVPAARLFSGDTSLVGRPLRIRVDGLYPPAALDPRLRQGLPLAIDLEAVFPPPEPAVSQEPVRAYVWGLRRRPGWSSPSSPVSFPFPLDWDALPEFVMTVRPARGEPMVLTTRFTLDDESGVPRLRRGVYLFGFIPGAWDWEVGLKDLARVAPAELFSVLVTIDSEVQPERLPGLRRRERP